jgi:HEAT repeat protein
MSSVWNSLPVSERRRLTVVAGHTGDVATARTSLVDVDSSVRVVAVGAVARLGELTIDDITSALSDIDSLVVRRTIEVVAATTFNDVGTARIDDLLVLALAGLDDSVAEVAAWALGERHQEEGDDAPHQIMSALMHAATSHAEALVRESAAAALGAVGHIDGLPAILAACRDKATVRRRAVLALAAFDGPDVTEALQRALSDRDWQVRQAAEDLLAIDANDAGPSAQT